MQEFLRKIRQLRFSELTTQEIVVGLIAVLVGLWAVSFILDLIRTIVPILIVVLLVYLGYQWLTSRGKDADEAIISVRAEQRAKERQAQDQQRRDEEARRRIADQPRTVEVAPAAPPQASATISQTNPETGLEEVDLARLEEREQALLKETKEMSADIQAQIEARRKRLLNQQDEDAQG